MPDHTQTKKATSSHSSDRDEQRAARRPAPAMGHEWRPWSGSKPAAPELGQRNDGDTINADLGSFHDRRRTTAKDVSTRLALGIVVLETQALQAAGDFLAYARPRAERLDAENSHTVLLTAVAAVLLAPMTAMVTAPASPVLAPMLTQALSELRGLASKTIGAMATEKSLTRGLSVIPQALGDAIAALRRSLIDPVQGQLDELQAAGRSKSLVIPAALEELEKQFFDATSAEIDETLPGLGLPCASRADKYYAECYHELVLAFEREYVWAAASHHQRLQMSLSEGGGIGYGNAALTRDAIAERRADRALDQRLEQRSLATPWGASASSN